MQCQAKLKRGADSAFEISESSPVKRDRKGSECPLGKVKYQPGGILTSRIIRATPDVLTLSTPNRLRIFKDPMLEYPEFSGCPDWAVPLLFLENQVLILSFAHHC